MNWKTLTKTAKRTLSRNGSKILLGFGIAGAFTAVGFAISATPKAMILLEEKKQELGVEKLDAKTIVKTAAPVYIPTAISMAVSTGCIIGASSVNDRRNAALAAAYTMSETALRSYQDKVAATIGEDKAQEIKEAVTLEKMAKCPEPDEIPTAKNLAPDDVSYDKKVKCWESLSGKYFWTTRNAIEKALNGLNKQLLSDLSVTENDLYDYLGIRNVENAANRKLRTNGHLFLNEVIDMLDPYGKGCHRTAVGQVAGWIYDPKDETKQNCVSLGTHCYVPGNEALNDFINGDERSVMLHFNCDGPIIDKI